MSSKTPAKQLNSLQIARERLSPCNFQPSVQCASLDNAELKAAIAAGASILDRIELNHYVLPELEDGLSGLFVELENGKSFQVEFDLASVASAASGLKIRDARNSGLVKSVRFLNSVW